MTAEMKFSSLLVRFKISEIIIAVRQSWRLVMRPTASSLSMNALMYSITCGLLCSWIFRLFMMCLRTASGFITSKISLRSYVIARRYSVQCENPQIYSNPYFSIRAWLYTLSLNITIRISLVLRVSLMKRDQTVLMIFSRSSEEPSWLMCWLIICLIVMASCTARLWFFLGLR